MKRRAPREATSKPVALRIRVRFMQSRSSYLAATLRLAKTFPTFRVTGVDKDTVYSLNATIRLNQTRNAFLDKENRKTWERVRKLLHQVGFWRHGEVRITGWPIKDSLTLQEQLERVDTCFRRRERSGGGDCYCAGQRSPSDYKTAFGCQLLKGVNRVPPYQSGHNAFNTGWWQLGTLAKDLSTFSVDKRAILKRLQSQTGDSLCVLCPAFSWKRVDCEIAELPSIISLKKGSEFVVKYAEFDKSNPVGIMWGDELHGFEMSFDDGDGLEDEPRAEPQRSVPTVHYSDVAGQDEALAEVRNVVQLPLTHPEYFEALGIQGHRGILLYGPPGNGKTLIAKAVATESSAHLELVNGPELLSKWVGQTEENLRNVFVRARKFAPSVILIDEIDAIASDREEADQQHEVSFLSQLLVLLDGLEERGQVLVVATTNRVDALDPAITRPGRFDYHVEVPRPKESGRLELLRALTKKMKVDRGVNLPEIAKRTTGCSGADLAALCREAGMSAVLRGVAGGKPARGLKVTVSDFDAALAGMSRKRTRKPIKA